MNKADIIYIISLFMAFGAFGASCKYDHPVAGGIVVFMFLLSLKYSTTG